MSAVAGVESPSERVRGLLEAQRVHNAEPGATLVGHAGEWAVRLDPRLQQGAVSHPEAATNTPLAVTLLPGALARPATDGGLPWITFNSSILPRVQADGDGVVLSSSNGPRYATLRELGRGGMGEVDLVEDRDIGRTVAMKRLLADQDGLDAVARFVDEVRTIGRLEHPNIVPIHDVGIDERGRFFFVMKYVDGETLETIIERLRAGDAAYVARFDRTRRVEIFQQILRALQFAHGRGIIHRDLKPANVMVGRFGEVVLMDWGVARTFGPDAAAIDSAALGSPRASSDEAGGSGIGRAITTEAGALIGTPYYMSPEQARGENDTLDQRSDLYSATLLFHEWLGLEHLRAHHDSLLGLLVAAVSEPPPSVMQLFARYRTLGIGAEYAHFVGKGLQLQPADRYQSAADMLDDLHRILAGTFRVQCPVTFIKRVFLALSHQVDRAPGVVIGVAMTTALGMLLLLGYVAADLMATGMQGAPTPPG
ncbi:MAG: serine/threonine protein kinase [Myxococcales bacterium]|nr:serine/threonine protein kinase [Myxococcales bacterium]